MNGFRLLVCIDGSHASLEAARLAIRLISQHGGRIRAVSVIDTHEITRHIDARIPSERSAKERIEQGSRSVLDRVVAMGADAQIAVDSQLLHGDPLRAIMRDAREWAPNLVLIGRTGRSGPGSPMVGSLAMHLVEFSEWPIVVVPEAP